MNVDVPAITSSGYYPSTLRSRPASPALSNRSRKLSSRGAEPIAASSEGIALRRDQNARISYFDPANQATLDRLISNAGGHSDVEGEEENAQATMSNVEEMLEGYEWASDDVIGRKTARGAADLIEARLLDELMALDKVGHFSCIQTITNLLGRPTSIHSSNLTIALALS